MSLDPSCSSTVGVRTHLRTLLYRLLRVLTSVSLDAPLVCLGWLLLFARVGAVHLPRGGTVILFLSVWLAYAADRWFDTWRIRSPGRATDRHVFAFRHRRAIATVWIAVLILTLTLALMSLDRDLLLRGFVLLGGVLAYFAAVHLGPPRIRRFIPKELVASLILVSGIRLFLTEDAAPVPFLIALGLLFLGNCLLIATWESHSDQDHQFPSMAITLPLSLTAIRWILGFLIPLTLLAPIVLNDTSTRIAPPLGLSAALLLALDRVSTRWPPSLLRSLADIALMTPWLMWVGMGWRGHF